ncbi:MAG TPA: sulfite exporter TauE/SafE family protein [Gammaproteobacteria bacterium]|nr:sulfite exporter TauE/SafE family protein [Gammaproteobacteria bacterium]
MDVGYIVSGFGVGLLVGITGVGGGALMTPLLIFGFGISPAVAVGTDLVFAAITKASGVWTHARQSTVDWRVVGRLASGSLPAALLTLAVLGEVDTHSAEAQGFITTLLGVALMLTAAALLWRSHLSKVPHRHDDDGVERKGVVLATVAAGVVLGVLVTLTSVGAGALGAAALFWLYPRFSAVRVVGTDIAHAVPLTAVAGFGHWQMGSVDTGLLMMLLIGSLPGIYLGSRLSKKIPERWLRPALATLLLVIGFRMVA